MREQWLRLRPRSLGAWLSHPRRPTSLRSHLLSIVVVAFVPLLLFSVVTTVLFAHEERRIFERGAKERTLALLTAVDTELKRSIAALEALATSDDLVAGDLESFRADAQRVLESRPEWLNVHLAPPNGLQVMNLLRPPGRAFHQVIDDDSFRETVRSAQPVVGHVFREPITARQVFPVRVPIVRDERVLYVVSALVRPEVIHELLAPQGLPADWVCVVLDDDNAIVARTIGQDLVGRRASDSLRAALAASPHGWFEGSTIEGWHVYTPFNRSEFSGWSVAIGIPAADVEAPLYRSLAWLGAFGVVLLGSGIGLAWLLSRRPARSLEEVAAMAEDLGLGRKPGTQRAERPVATGISEVEEIRKSFLVAAELIRARSEERDRVEASLRRVEAELRESEHRKDRFLAMLGHELRNPLGVVSTAVQLLRATTREGSAAAEPRVMIERQVAHMTKLLDDLLDVSRIAEGRIQVNRSLCDLVAMVREAVEDHRADLERSGIKLELALPVQPLWLMGDRVRLAQAVANLLQNANKYTDAGGTVTVRLAEEAGGESAVLSVRDTGVGMEPEILEHAFEPFSQADRTIARSRGGLGLGLALVKGLVELHGGSVRAASEGSGRGTEVVVRLPLEAVLGTPAVADAAREATPSRPRRILVVEDHGMAARSMQLYLTGQGHAVEVAHSGPAGIEAARHFEPEVVLCDIGLPGADGYQVARTLRAGPGGDRLTLVAVSGYGQEADRRHAREAGFDEHLTKPVDLDELRRILGGP